jgi:hypothetical protein
MLWFRRFAGLRVIFLLSWAPSIWGQLTERPSPELSARYSLEGTVINAVTGEPVGRALVQAYVGKHRLALTDSNGHFEFDDLATGPVPLGVNKPGFLDGQQSRRNTPKAGPNSAPAVLKLIPESLIYGRVLDSSGEPLEHVPVKALKETFVDGRKRWQVAGGAPTNYDGEFRITGLTEGSYYLEAGPTLRFLNMRSLKELLEHPSGYGPVFYPAAPDLNSAALVELAAGQQFRADFSLQPTTLFKVSGAVVGIAGENLELQFSNSAGDSFSFPMDFDPKSGEFQTAAPLGAYTLTGSLWNGGEPMIAETALNISSNLAGIRLMVEPTRSISVTIRTETTHREPTVVRQIRGSLPPVNVRLVADGPSSGPSEYWAQPQPGSNTTSLAIPNIPPGKYRLQLDANGNWYAASAQCGRTDLLQEELVLSAGTHPASIEIVLRDDSANLSGKISSEVNDSAAIVLLPERATEGARSIATTSNGEFVFQGLAPGDYNVLAFDHVDRLEYANPAVMDRYLSAAAHVSLVPGGNDNVTLGLIHVQQ